VSDEQARRVFRELQALARADYGGNTGALLVVYGVEGFCVAWRHRSTRAR
jgi:hypothetical protein